MLAPLPWSEPNALVEADQLTPHPCTHRPPPTAHRLPSSLTGLQDSEEEVLRSAGCALRTFDKVRVRISVDSSKAHRPKLKLQITQPVLPKA